MDSKTVDTIAYMITKECQRNSPVDLCEAWEISVDDFYKFIEAGKIGCKEDSPHE